MKKREKKIKVAKEPKDKFSLRMKRFYFGVIKEFRRVT
jgi:preprotein translocase subunit SecE